MKLLFVLQELPYPASSGYRQKMLTLLNYLALRHDCDVLAIGSQSDATRCEPWLEHLPRLRVLGVFAPDPVRFVRARQGLALLRGAIASSMRYRSRGLEAALKQAVAQTKYDVVHVDLVSMADYCAQLGAGKRVLSLNDVLSLARFGRARDRYASLTSRLGALVQGFLQLRVDRRLFHLADAVHYVSPDEADWCRTRLGARNAVRIPLAVHSEFLRIVPSADVRREQTLVIVEKLWTDQHSGAVERFLAAHWLRLRQKHPEVRLVVIGGRGMRASFCRFVAGLPGVQLHEWVDRLEDVLSEAAIAVFPYSDEVGMKNRVLQCMAAANAVVGTSNAFLGIPVRSGLHAVIADSHADMAAAIDLLLADPDASRDMGHLARRFVESRFTEEVVGMAWEQLYSDIVAGAPIRNSYGATDSGIET